MLIVYFRYALVDFLYGKSKTTAVKSQALRNLKREETLSASTSIIGYTFLFSAVHFA